MQTILIGKPYTVKYPSRNKTDLHNKPVQVPFEVAPPEIRNPFIIPGIKKIHFDPKLNPDYNFNNYVEGECTGWQDPPVLLSGIIPEERHSTRLWSMAIHGLGETQRTLAQAYENSGQREALPIR